MKNKGLYVVAGVLGMLALLLGGVGIVYAQGWTPPEGETPSDCGPGRGLHGASPVGVTAELAGLTVQEVVAALEAGQTLAEVAEANGVDAQAVVDALVAERETALSAAVAEGRLTEEQAQQMLAEMAERLAAQMDEPWQPKEGRGGLGGPMGPGGPGRGGRQGRGMHGGPSFAPGADG